ncbi:MAG: hypothetical protein H6635_06545 [Anaerolineales bacterium]|nr:hypothetical protein [Anaerolineales bacterium]MCB9145012.1 hypothetical protein [Anaerolineales bacterium]
MKKNLMVISTLIMAFLLAACSFGQAAPNTETDPVIEATQPPATEEAIQAALTEAPIVHTTIPSEPEKNLGNASDNDETLSHENFDVNFGDDFVKNRFERPFTANMGEYLPEIDIVKFSIGEDDNFFYVTMTLGGLPADGQALSGHYAIEVDGNIDGRGELLIVASPPFGADWSTDGVQIFADNNGDLGGENPRRRDENYNGDGYETLVFDNGRGSNPDLGWARFTNSEAPEIEIAFSKVIFPKVPSFMWSVWASKDGFDPTKFNLHDTTTEEAAGSPDKQNSFYPITGIAAVDNSCRVPVGFQATGTEPLGCPVAGVPEEEGGPASGGSTPGFCQLYPVLCKGIILIPIPTPIIIK